MRLSIENFIFLKIEGVNGILFGELTLLSPKERVLKVDFLWAPGRAFRSYACRHYAQACIRFNPWRGIRL